MQGGLKRCLSGATPTKIGFRGQGNHRVWQLLGVATAAGGVVWAGWATIVDFVGHLDAIPGVGPAKAALAVAVGNFATKHPNWLSDYGPLVFVACGIGLFLTPYLRPFVDRLLTRLEASRTLDAPGGWSVSINAGQGMVSSIADMPEAMMAFQQFRLVNISNERRRIIDVTITLPSAKGSAAVHVYRSNQSDKSRYQVALESLRATSDKGDIPRRFSFINFPLALEPSQMVDGQIVIDLPDVIKSSADLHALVDVHHIQFEFTEHISGKSIVLGFGETFDAHRGRVEKPATRPTTKRPRRMELGPKRP